MTKGNQSVVWGAVNKARKGLKDDLGARRSLWENSVAYAESCSERSDAA